MWWVGIPSAYDNPGCVKEKPEPGNAVPNAGRPSVPPYIEVSVVRDKVRRQFAARD